MNLKILQIISRTALAALIGIFIISIFFKPFSKIIFSSGGYLFFTAILSEVLYQVLSGRNEAKIIKSKKSAFIHLPSGLYKIVDRKTNASLGELSRENVDFLRKRFLKQAMDDNDFCFLSETIEMFLEEEKPNKELSEFLINAMKNKNEVELHWEPIKRTQQE
jgi:hypothetical protein